MMQTTFRRQNVPEEDIQPRIDRIVASLTPGASYTFRYASPSAQVVEVRRRRLPNGSVVETVRQVEGQSTELDLNAQFEMIAEKSRSRLTHALDVMADGFALYDADDRLILYNRKYVDYSPLVADIIMPGAPRRKSCAESVRRGALVLNGMDPEDYIAWRLHRHRNPGEPLEVQLADGRWILITEKRTDDGGVVGTRSDITEMKQREMEMLRISQQLHAKNLQFDTALTNMVQGLCMFDKDQRLIVVNRRYLEIYGFSPDVVKPGITLRGLMEYTVSLGNYTAEEAERALAERNDPARLQQAHRHQAAPEGRPGHRRHERADVRRRHDRHLSGHHRSRNHHRKDGRVYPQTRALEPRAGRLRLCGLARSAGAAAQDRGLRRPAAARNISTFCRKKARCSSTACRVRQTACGS